jgi:hypothetical protein
LRIELRQIEGSEAPHRDAADREAFDVCIQRVECFRDGLNDDVASPVAVVAVVEVARFSAVDQENRRRVVPEILERAEHLLRQHLFGRTTATVEEDDHALWDGLRSRHDRDLIDLPADEVALEGDV